MNGQIAQLCALACHANHVLSGQPLPNGFEANSTFRYCEFVRFFRRMPVVRIVSEVAATPAEWIRGLARQSSKSVLLVAVPRDDPSLPEHVAVAYAGGIRWALVVTGAEGSPTTWSSKWEVGDRDREDKRIWRVEYLAGSESLAVDNPALADAQQELDRSLDAALELARDNAWDYWADRLAAAKRQLSGTPEQVFHADIAPDGFLDKDAEELIRACQISWVFGGMGSWNDLSPGARQEDYQKISNDLYDAVTKGIIAAVNHGAVR